MRRRRGAGSWVAAPNRPLRWHRNFRHRHADTSALIAGRDIVRNSHRVPVMVRSAAIWRLRRAQGKSALARPVRDRPAGHTQNYFSEPSNQNRVSSVCISMGVFDWWEDELLRCRENIPLAVMGVISLAVLFIFGVSEMAMRTTPRQLDGCGVSQQASIPIGSNDDASFPPALSSPAFPPSLPSRLSGPDGCTRSSTTAIG
jgi:hypothetical protein